MNVRRWFGLVGGLALVGLLLLLPAPLRHPSTASAQPAATPSGPAGLSLKAAWPNATVFSLPGGFPDGSTYLPQTLLDATTSIGLATSADLQSFSLVQVVGSGQPRVLDSSPAKDGASFDAVTPTADAIYWMRTVNDAEGHAQVSLWTARRSGGPNRRVSSDVGAPLFFGSAHDMQVVGDRLYWLAGTTTAATELRSIPLAGGRVTVRSLTGAWTMAAWPWLVTAPSTTGTPVELFNLDTGVRVPVHAPANKMVACSPTWCRLIADNPSQTSTTDLVHPDGTDLRQIGDQNAVAFASDVALRQRFEPLLTALTSANSTTVSRLDLYDIARRRTVLIEPAATNAGAKGDYLWWSTGDNETIAWHALDLRTVN